jgi:hypothetical protein
MPVSESRHLITQLATVSKKLAKQPDTPSMELTQSLVASARLALENATLEQASVVRDQLRTVEQYFKLRGAKLIQGNLLVAQRLRTERKMGGMLAEQIRHQGGRKGRDYDESMFLANGISKQDSSKWQRIAIMDDADFEDWVSENANTKELSTAALLRELAALYVDEDAEEELSECYCCALVGNPDGVAQWANFKWQYGTDMVLDLGLCPDCSSEVFYRIDHRARSIRGRAEEANPDSN